MKKLVYCESCDAEFRITHNMDKRLYKIMHCPFCGDDLNEENEDLLEEYEDEWSIVITVVVGHIVELL